MGPRQHHGGSLRSLRGMLRVPASWPATRDFATAIYLLAALFAAMTVIIQNNGPEFVTARWGR